MIYYVDSRRGSDGNDGLSRQTAWRTTQAVNDRCLCGGDEVLFRAGLDPFRPGTAMREAEFRAMWDDLVALMAVGVDTGAIHTIRDEHDHGDLPRRGTDRPRNYVYQRDGWECRVCGTEIALQTMEARTLFWCPTCQAGRGSASR